MRKLIGKILCKLGIHNQKVRVCQNGFFGLYCSRCLKLVTTEE